jgi:PAS domain S-box-containing protein
MAAHVGMAVSVHHPDALIAANKLLLSAFCAARGVARKVHTSGYLSANSDADAMPHTFDSHALQAALLASTHVATIVTNAAGVIQVFNVGAERAFGFAPCEVLDKVTPAAFADPDELVARARLLSGQRGARVEPGFEALTFKAARDGEDVFPLTQVRKDGSRFRAEVSARALLDAQGDVKGFLLFITGATRGVELHATNVVTQQLNLANADFLSSMSHELRSPLTAILGFAQLMESDSPKPTASQGESLREIRKAGRHLLQMINEILDLAKIESGRLSLSLEPVSLATVMLECQGMTEAPARARGVRMAFPLLTTPCFVRVDSTRLKQVLMNLLTNAIQYNRPEGTVTVRCDVSTPGRVRVSIADQGPGLTPEQLVQLFQPFHRVGREASGQEGTGLGLAVARQLLELMGGAMGVDSVVGSGSVFWFEVNTSVEPEAALR